MQDVRCAHLDIFIEAVPVPLLEESERHPFAHDARPDNAPLLDPLLHHLSPPAAQPHVSLCLGCGT